MKGLPGKPQNPLGKFNGLTSVVYSLLMAWTNMG